MNVAVETKSATARDRMAALSQKFHKRCADDVVLMHQALERFEAGEPQALVDMHHMAHRMNGTGATLGFGVLGDIAAKLERFLDSLPAAAPSHGTSVTTIRELLDVLAAEIARR